MNCTSLMQPINDMLWINKNSMSNCIKINELTLSFKMFENVCEHSKIVTVCLTIFQHNA